MSKPELSSLRKQEKVYSTDDNTEDLGSIEMKCHLCGEKLSIANYGESNVILLCTNKNVILHYIIIFYSVYFLLINMT